MKIFGGRQIPCCFRVRRCCWRACAAFYPRSNISDLITLLQLSSTSAFNLLLARATVPVNMPPLAAFAANHPVPLFSMTAALWISGCVLALGVWRRAEWARRGAVAMLYVLSAGRGTGAPVPSLIVPAPLIYGGVSIAPEFNAAVRSAALSLRWSCMIGEGCASGGRWRSTAARLKPEFGNERTGSI